MVLSFLETIFGTITRRTRSKKGTTRKERRKAIKKKS
jgi:hypothetical protein